METITYFPVLMGFNLFLVVGKSNLMEYDVPKVCDGLSNFILLLKENPVGLLVVFNSNQKMSNGNH